MRYCQEKGIVCQYAGTNMHCRLTACVFPKESLYPVASGGGHLMDIEKLIEKLKNAAGGPEGIKMCHDAATALSAIQAENKRLNKIVCSIPTTPDSGRTVSQYDKEMSMCAYLDDLEAENEKLRAELEQVKAERDAAVESIPHECKTCVYHTVFFNGCTPDHDCTNPDGGCSNNCDRWKWRGQKED